MRRRFNSGERVALYLHEDGYCARCGCELKQGWHGDHEIPFSRGGETDVANGQALCPDCNQRKGASMEKSLFAWQEHAIDLFIRNMAPDFLCEATPAAGKTRVAAEIATRLRAADITRYIVAVVPTSRLRKQTAQAFLHMTGLQLNYEWQPGNGVFPDGPFNGVAVTYQTVAGNAALFRRHCNKFPTLAVLDEVHHASHQQTWGMKLFEAFELARHRVLLSGTPFRSDAGRIPFVRYVDGKGVADVSYGYADALTDGIVREVYFPRIGGKMEWLDDGVRQAATFNEDLDELGQSRRLRTSLMADGGVVLDMLRDAHSELNEMRNDDPDAAGLVLAIDQDHAVRIAARMKRELGIDPVVAISDDDTSDDAIEDFISSGAPWIVAVRMVSEGVDIPRLRICVYASNIVTELFFRQVVGRVVRREQDTDQQWSHVYIPDDPRLRQFAEDIRKQRELVLGKEDETKPPGTPPTPRAPSGFVPLSATGEQAGAIGADEYFTPPELDYARKVMLQSRDTAGLSVVKVAMILRNSGKMGSSGTLGGTTQAPQDATARLRKIKQENESVSRRIAFRFGLANKDVNARLNQLAGIRSVKTCFDETKLEQRRQIALQWLASGDAAEAANG